MYKYIKSYKLGYIQGIKDAYIENKNKKFIKIDNKQLTSKLYDAGYIEGYLEFIKNIKKDKQL